MSFGERLQKSRAEKGWTLDDLAARVELTAPYLSKVERGLVLPRRDTLLAILESLEADPTEALAERDKEELMRLGRDPEVADVMIDVELLAPELRARVLDLVRGELAELRPPAGESSIETGAARAR